VSHRLRAIVGSPWLWALILVVVSMRWGARLQAETPEMRLGAAPLVGRDETDGWDWRFGWGLVGAGAVAGVVILAGLQRWWWEVSLRLLVPLISISAAAFAVLLALADGSDGLLQGAVHPTEYLVSLGETPPAGAFLRGFVADLGGYSVHVRGHPPGFMLILKALDAVGLSGGWPVVGLLIVATALMPAGVLVGVWAAAGEQWVRRSAPLLVVAPYALWMVTSADALYTAFGGLALSGLLFLTYGGAMFLLLPMVPMALALWRRIPGARLTTVAAVAVAILVTAAFARAGFWWFDGAAATKGQYWAGTARLRPWEYFALANLTAALIAVGPATFGGLLRLWQQRRTPPAITVLVLGGSLALAASHLSQYTRAEVERIWLLFYPWLAISGGVFIAAERRLKTAVVVGAQAISAITLQAVLVSKW
jgi:methylthioxylose transferase